MLMNYGVQSVLNLQKHPDVLAMNRREGKGGAFLSSVRKIRTVQAVAGGGGGGRQPMLVDTSCFLETRTVLLYEPTDTAAMASQCPVAWRLQGGGEGWSTLRWTVAQQAGGGSAAWLFMNATLALTRWTGAEPERLGRARPRGSRSGPGLPARGRAEACLYPRKFTDLAAIRSTRSGEMSFSQRPACPLGVITISRRR